MVAGGAGHVRRIATKDGKALQAVLRWALSVVDSCDSDSSCYHCLRQKKQQRQKKVISF